VTDDGETSGRELTASWEALAAVEMIEAGLGLLPPDDDTPPGYYVVLLLLSAGLERLLKLVLLIATVHESGWPSGYKDDRLYFGKSHDLVALARSVAECSSGLAEERQGVLHRACEDGALLANVMKTLGDFAARDRYFWLDVAVGEGNLDDAARGPAEVVWQELELAAIDAIDLHYQRWQKGTQRVVNRELTREIRAYLQAVALLLTTGDLSGIAVGVEDAVAGFASWS
jgi:hypothetical protein